MSSNSKEEEKDLRDLYRALGYEFKDETLIRNALTHSSYCYEHRLNYRENNERLEFLGDAVFDAVIADELYARLTDREEGDLSRLRASIVCEQSLLRKAEELKLAGYMRLGHGEQLSAGSKKKKSLVADALEATIGAVYIDGGWENVKKLILRLFSDVIDDALSGRLENDYKTAIQEFLQSKGAAHISYRLERESGPDHDKTFFVSLRNNGVVIGRGSGNSKKQAQQTAAKQALEKMRG